MGCQDELEEMFSDQVCEYFDGCGESATHMIWVAHHALGCDATGFRCQIHLNLLKMEMAKIVQWIKFNESRDRLVACAVCRHYLDSGELSDYLRWAAL